MSIKYRPEIDGLRAIAVLFVVLYHARFKIFGTDYFRGGYIGVDVFFVISGFLITSIIASELDAGSFRFGDFFERRIRRIFPLLLTVMVTSSPFAWRYMSPKAFREYCGSLLSSLFFVSNMWFWKEDGYTAEPSALKPLLHTWSLSVEEQFYIVFPLCLFLIWKFARKRLTIAISTILLVSLISSHFLSLSAPDFNFFSAPTRFWELLCGSLLAICSRSSLLKGFENRSVMSFFSISGIAMVTYANFTFYDGYRHPSLFTLTPVIGTCLLILFCRPNGIMTSLLSSPILVSVGKLSYGIYLWHYPLFAIQRIRFGSLATLHKLILIGLSFILSIVSYRLLERPVRSRTRFSFRSVGIGLTAVYLVLLLGGKLGMSYILTSKPGMDDPALFHEFVKNARDDPASSTQKESKTGWKTCKDLKVPYQSGSCREIGNGKELSVIWGDSHAYRIGQFSPVLKPHQKIILLSLPGCPPIRGVRRYDESKSARRCDKIKVLNEVVQFVRKLHPKNIFLIARWSLYFHGNRSQDGTLRTESHHLLTNTLSDGKPLSPSVDLSRRLIRRKTIETVSVLSKKSHVFFLTQPPDMWKFTRSEILAQKKKGISVDEYVEWHRGELKLARKLSKMKNVRVLRLDRRFCRKEFCSTNNSGRLFYADSNHLNARGVEHIWPAISGAMSANFTK